MPVLAAAAVAACLSPVAVASAEPLFVITGRGWGHGVGMSQEGAKGMALHGYGSAAILRHYFSDTKLGTVPARTVRASLQAQGTPLSAWTLRAVGGPLKVAFGSTRSISLPAGTLVGFRALGTGVVVFRDADGDGIQDAGEKTAATFGGAVTAWARVSSTRSGLVQVHTASGPWGWNDIVWRGQVRLTPGTGRRAGSLYAVNHVAMEDYLRGVVPRESPASWPLEALKAQAIAARSFAFSELKSSTVVFDVLPTTSSQVYNGFGRAIAGGIDRNEDDRSDLAVKATAGQVVRYGNKVVTAYFFSTSGGRTENIENVWTGSAPQPYLRSVADPYEDASAPRHVWSETPTVKAATARSRLAAQGLPVPAVLADMVVTRRGPSGRATRIVLKGAAGDDKTLSGSRQIGRFQRAFGLWDTWLYITRCSVSMPGGVAGGADLRVTVTCSPAPRDGTAVVLRYGDARASKLPGLARGIVSGGVAVATVTGRDTPTDVIVTSGKKGTSTYYVSARYRASLARSIQARVTTKGTVATIYGSASPADGVGALRFDVLPPGAGRWRVVGSATATGRGSASITCAMKTTGLWRFRAYHPGGSGYVPTSSSAKAVYNVTDTRLVRFTGTDRSATSVSLARASGPYPRSGFVVIAGDGAPVDASAAAALAAGLDGPLLLTTPDRLSPTVRSWLVDKANGIKRVVVVGGPGAVSASVKDSLEAIVGQGLVTRVTGADRYASAGAVATTMKDAMSKWDGGVVVTDGESAVDALTASAAAATLRRPLLYVKHNSVPGATGSALAALGAKSVLVVGGPGSVSEGVATALASGGRSVTRVWGADRYATACALADRVVGEGGSWARIGVVPDGAMDDAVALVPYLARARGVLLLTSSRSLGQGARDRVHGAGKALKTVATSGGLLVVGPLVLDDVFRALP